MSRTAPIFAMMVLAVLAACGADGVPARPEARSANAITLSGEASAGFSGGN